MEAFKVRLIQEYNELNERIGKLSNFLKNPNGVELSEKMMAVIVLSEVYHGTIPKLGSFKCS